MELRHGTDTFLSTSLFEILKYSTEFVTFIRQNIVAHIHTPLMLKARHIVLLRKYNILCAMYLCTMMIFFHE